MCFHIPGMVDLDINNSKLCIPGPLSWGKPYNPPAAQILLIGIDRETHMFFLRLYMLKNSTKW